MFSLKIPGEPVWRPTSVDGNMTGALKIPSFNACQVPSTKCWGSFTEFCVIIFAKFLSWLEWVLPQQLSIQKSSKNDLHYVRFSVRRETKRDRQLKFQLKIFLSHLIIGLQRKSEVVTLCWKWDFSWGEGGRVASEKNWRWKRGWTGIEELKKQ